MISILGSDRWLYLQLVIILITLGLALYDLYTERIPNWINLVLFGFMLMIGAQLNYLEMSAWLSNMALVTIISFGLFLVGVLGGGDCKYLMALSPVIQCKVLFIALLIGMVMFVAVYALKQLLLWVKHRQFTQVPKLITGKMPFLWAMVPGLMAASLMH